MNWRFFCEIFITLVLGYISIHFTPTLYWSIYLLVPCIIFLKQEKIYNKNIPKNIFHWNSSPFFLAIAIYLLIFILINSSVIWQNGFFGIFKEVDTFDQNLTKSLFWAFIAIILISLQNWINFLDNFDDFYIAKEVNNLGWLKINQSYNFGFMLFILSEVLVFVGFFWVLFSIIWTPTYGIGEIWPPKGIPLFNVFHIPLFNTLILTFSSFFFNIAIYYIKNISFFKNFSVTHKFKENVEKKIQDIIVNNLSRTNLNFNFFYKKNISKIIYFVVFTNFMCILNLYLKYITPQYTEEEDFCNNHLWNI